MTAVTFPYDSPRTGQEEVSKAIIEAVRRMSASDEPILLGVMGGKFSYGEDFSPGSLATFAVVCLPPPFEGALGEDGFRQVEGRAIDLQIASYRPGGGQGGPSRGRFFRRKGQREVVMMDKRFRRKHVLDLFPLWLKEGVAWAVCSRSSVREAEPGAPAILRV